MSKALCPPYERHKIQDTRLKTKGSRLPDNPVSFQSTRRDEIIQDFKRIQGLRQKEKGKSEEGIELYGYRGICERRKEKGKS